MLFGHYNGLDVDSYIQSVTRCGPIWHLPTWVFPRGCIFSSFKVLHVDIIMFITFVHQNNILHRKQALTVRTGGRHSNTSVVHLLDHRNPKKGLFFETERDSQESWLGVTTYLFSRKSFLFEFYYGVLRGHFSNFSIPQTCSKRNLVRGKIGCKTTQNSCLGVSFLKRTNILLGYVLKTSGHAYVQHQYFSAPLNR